MKEKAYCRETAGEEDKPDEEDIDEEEEDPVSPGLLEEIQKVRGQEGVIPLTKLENFLQQVHDEDNPKHTKVVLIATGLFVFVACCCLLLLFVVVVVCCLLPMKKGLVI